MSISVPKRLAEGRDTAQSTFSSASPLLRRILLNHYTKRSRRMSMAQSTLSSASTLLRVIHLNQYT